MSTLKTVLIPKYKTEANITMILDEAEKLYSKLVKAALVPLRRFIMVASICLLMIAYTKLSNSMNVNQQYFKKIRKRSSSNSYVKLQRVKVISMSCL